MIHFAKLQAAGNAYLALDGRSEPQNWSRLARTMAARHTGVGSDGLVVVQASERAALRMRVFNSDGSEAEMSGNGLRLFAKFSLERGFAELTDGALQVETGGGVRTVWPVLESGRMKSARIAMGVPALTHAGTETVLTLPERSLAVTTLSVGNPHAVHLTEEPVACFPLEEVGRSVQAHPAFPSSVNFEVVRVLNRGTIEARVFERGEGETRSSGTGSTASAVAARLSGQTDADMEIQLPGGMLRVRFDGPTEEVFSGTWPTDSARSTQMS